MTISHSYLTFHFPLHDDVPVLAVLPVCAGVIAAADAGWLAAGDPKWDMPDTGGNICCPHGFADDKRERLHLALDGIRQFFLVKIPLR